MFCSEARTETMARMEEQKLGVDKLSEELEQKWNRLSRDQQVKFYWKAFKEMEPDARKVFNPRLVLGRCRGEGV